MCKKKTFHMWDQWKVCVWHTWQLTAHNFSSQTDGPILKPGLRVNTYVLCHSWFGQNGQDWRFGVLVPLKHLLAYKITSGEWSYWCDPSDTCQWQLAQSMSKEGTREAGTVQSAVGRLFFSKEPLNPANYCQRLPPTFVSIKDSVPAGNWMDIMMSQRYWG